MDPMMDDPRYDMQHELTKEIDMLRAERDAARHRAECWKAEYTTARTALETIVKMEDKPAWDLRDMDMARVAMDAINAIAPNDKAQFRA